MRKYFWLKPIQLIFILASMCIIFVQCESNQKPGVSVEIPSKDTLIIITKLPLPAFELRLKDLIDQNKLHQSILIKDPEYFDLAHVDEGYDTTYAYRLIHTLSKNPQLPVYIIAREYENEDIAWYCKYNHQHKIEYIKEIFYENAEGNLLIESKFKNDTLTLFIDDVNEGKVREVFVLDSGYKFSDLKK